MTSESWERPGRSERSEATRIILSTIVAVVIGAVFLWLAARSVSLEDMGSYLAVADWRRIGLVSLVFMGLYGICHGARVVRWYYLVRPLGEVKSGDVHRVCTVGFLAVVILPLRLGELVRPLLLARTTGVSGSGALGTVVVERVIDGLIVTGVLFLALWSYQGDGSVEAARALGTVAAMIFVPALFFALVGYYQREMARVVLFSTAGRVVPKVAEKVWELLDQFYDGVAGLARRRDLMPFAALTGLYWGMNWVAMWVLARFAFGLEVGFFEMITVLVVLVVGLMVPAGPAMAGNFEYFTVQGLGLYVPLEDSLVSGQAGAFAGALHVLQLAVIVLPGAWLLVRDRRMRFGGKSLKEARELGEAKN